MRSFREKDCILKMWTKIFLLGLDTFEPMTFVSFLIGTKNTLIQKLRRMISVSIICYLSIFHCPQLQDDRSDAERWTRIVQIFLIVPKFSHSNEIAWCYL